MTEAVFTSETSVHFNLTTLRYNPEDSKPELFSLKKSSNSRTRKQFTDEYLEWYTLIAETEIKPDIEKLIMQTNVKYLINDTFC
jgi:hypothetical protein